MTVSGIRAIRSASGRLPSRDGLSPGRPARLGAPWLVALIAWTTRALGVLCIVTIVLAPMRRQFGLEVRDVWGMSGEVGLAGAVVTLLAGTLLLLLANGLQRGKRRAWQVSVLLSTTVTIASAVRLDRPPEVVPALIAAGLLVSLIATRRAFTARPDPLRISRVLRVAGQLALSGFVVVWLLLALNPHKLVGRPGGLAQAAHAAMALVGTDGPVGIRSVWFADLTAATGLSFGSAAAVTASYLLLRTFEPRPRLAETDEHHLRALLSRWGGQDSLGYFALRPDKSVLLSPSGKAAISYRVLAGVALASGDPLGDPEAWPGAIQAFLQRSDSYAWTPAVLGCSERGAHSWMRHGLNVLELGDEAILELSEFSVRGRRMRAVRQASTRLRRAGYTVTVSRVADLTAQRRTLIRACVDRWRGADTERGYSMALSRLADPSDPDIVLVVAESHGDIHGVLQLVPGGCHGLSLDHMRRAPQAQNGINDFMITELIAECPQLGVERISLNFAVLRAALARGTRIGATPVARGWFKLLRLLSRWWQIESLYRFNTRFHPRWTPRYIAFRCFHNLPRVAFAALEAEGFGGRPSVLTALLHRHD